MHWALLFWNIGSRVRNGKALFEGSLAKESIGKKILVLVTGKKFSISELKAKWHIYPLEDVTEEENDRKSLKRKIVIMPKDEGRDEIVQRLSKAADEGKIDSKVWATPGLPMLIFVTVGLIIALSLGRYCLDFGWPHLRIDLLLQKSTCEKFGF